MQCPKCANVLPDGTRYCHYCGEFIAPQPELRVNRNITLEDIRNAPAPVKEPKRQKPEPVLKKPGYTVFSPGDRLNRLKYLYFCLLGYAGIVVMVISMIQFLNNGTSGWMALPAAVFAVALYAVQFVTAVKRLHDIGESGYNVWLLLVPFYGIYVAFKLLFTDSQEGASGPMERNSWYWQVPLTVLPLPVLMILSVS